VTGRVFRGVPASGGVASGAVWMLSPRPGRGGGNGSVGSPGLDVDQAFDAVARDLAQTAERLREGGHPEEAEIVAVGALIAEDPVLRDEVNEAVRSGKDPELAIASVAERHAATMEALRDPTLRERAADIRQVARRAASFLRGERPAAPAGPGPRVLVAEELGPAEVIGPGGSEVAAGVAVRGGPNSHAAIVARSLGLPLVLGVESAILEVPDGTAVVVDGDQGTVTVQPAEDEMGRAVAAMEAATRRRAALAEERGLPCRTTDGVRIGLLCNVATAAETAAGLEAGADGVGLLRTELTFLEATEWPDEDAHRRALDPILRLLPGKRAIVRILDFGGDKVPPFLSSDLPNRAGPHLRGLPSLLRSKDALAAQLRAALDLGRASRLGILVPMVTSLREVRMARSVLEGAAGETGVGVPELGVMVEVPSAALLADRLAQELEFLSIGTNDLTEHVLGVNRRDPAARPALAAHPVVLTLMNRVARAGRDHGCAVRVCGEGAADPLVLPLLVGIGVESVSVSPARVDEVRARVRRLSAQECADAARAAMACDSVDEVWDLVRRRAWPDLP
jgi:phosphoenolpyruvate-protein kinase (PTS system EI component)